MSQLPLEQTGTSAGFGSLFHSKLILPMVGILLFGLLFWGAFYGVATYRASLPFLRGPYALSVNGDEVSWEEFDSKVVYAKTVQDIKDARQARRLVTDALIEERLVREEAKRRRVEPDQVMVNLKLAGRQDAEAKRAIEYAVLKEQIEKKVVAKRTGKIIIIAFGFPNPQLAGVSQKELARSKIETAKASASAGLSLEEVAARLEQDTQVQALNPGTVLVPFTDWDRQRDLFSKEVTDTIFNTPQGLVSSIFTVANDPNTYGREPNHIEFAFAFLKVETISDGGEPTYADWLKKTKEKSIIELHI